MIVTVEVHILFRTKLWKDQLLRRQGNEDLRHKRRTQEEMEYCRHAQQLFRGAASVGNHVETEMVHLFDLTYTGCVSCFSCKRDVPSYGNGKCALKDDLYDLLPKLAAADGIVFGSPIYFYDITAQLRGFLERLWFPYSSYDGLGEGSMFPRTLPTAMIYTMNANEKQMQDFNFQKNLSVTEGWIELIFHARAESIYAFNTYQFTDYSKYKASLFSENVKAEWRKRQFPLDCQAAFDAGKRMAERALPKV